MVLYYRTPGKGLSVKGQRFGETQRVTAVTEETHGAAVRSLALCADTQPLCARSCALCMKVFKKLPRGWDESQLLTRDSCHVLMCDLALLECSGQPAQLRWDTVLWLESERP